MSRFLKVLMLAAVVAVPAHASAAVLTYYPSGSSSGTNDLQDLDHTMAYSWTIAGIPTVTAGTQITSAYITFKNLYNWDNSANMLFLDLYDTAGITGQGFISSNTGDANGALSGGAYTSTIRGYQDASGAPVTTIQDNFDGSNPLLSGNHIDLTQHAFLPGSSVNATYNAPNDASDITWLKNLLTSAGLNSNDATFGATNPQWSFTANGSGWDYTYQFTASQLTTLTAYINGTGADTGTISLALDPDCHFYNDGVSFTIITGSTGGAAAVPEPTSLVLLGTGLLITAKRYRSRRTKQAAK